MTTQSVVSPGGSRGRRAMLVTALLASVPALLAYLPTLGNGFVNWDDNLYVYRNPFVQRLDATFLRRALFDFTADNWHPVTWLSHAVDCALWGLNPRGHHLSSLVLHAVNTFLVTVTIARLGRLPGWRAGDLADDAEGAAGRPVLLASALAGLLFGLHPLHVESVAWVSERKDLLCAFFFLLALLAYAAYATAPGNRVPTGPRFPGNRHYLGAIGLFALALMSKPMAVSLPAILLVLDYCPFRRVRSWKTLRAAALEKLPFFLLSLLASAVTLLAQGKGGAIATLEEIPLAERWIVAVRSLGLYLAKIALPLDLGPFYPHPRGVELGSAASWAAGAVVAGATVAAVVAAQRRRRLWLAAWCWYVLILAPVLGIIQVGQQAMADRYAYLPSVAPLLIAGASLAWLWEWLGTRRRAGSAARAALAVAVAGALLALAALTVRQTRLWKDSITLWSAVIDREPAPPVLSFYNRALAYQESGRIPEALADYGKAIELDAADNRYFVNRGLLLAQTGRIGAAAADFEAACRLGDDFGCKAAQLYRSRTPARE